MTELHNEFDSCGAGLGSHQRHDRQRPAGFRRAEPRPGAREGRQAGQRRAERSRRRRACRGIFAGTSPFVARRGRQRRQRHPARGRDTAVADRRHPVRHRARRQRTCRPARKPRHRTCATWPAPGTRRPGLSMRHAPAVPRTRSARSPHLTKAGAELNRLLATVIEEQAAAERLNRTLDQALFTAQSRVHAVSDYIDNRRGSVGPEARTRSVRGDPTDRRRAGQAIHRPQRSDHLRQQRRVAGRAGPVAGRVRRAVRADGVHRRATAVATTWARDGRHHHRRHARRTACAADSAAAGWRWRRLGPDVVRRFAVPPTAASWAAAAASEQEDCRKWWTRQLTTP